MSVIDELMKTAVADTDVLRLLDSQGDRFSAHRDVEFLLRAPTPEKADMVASFINDHGSGVASVNDPEGLAVLVVIRMPIDQSVILSVSGFMVCLSRLFGLEYDGWGCVAQATRP
jgi:hypothetical protein